MLRFLVSLCIFSTVLPLWNLEKCVAAEDLITCSGIVPMRHRNDKISITDFGGVGDGKTSNTKAFREAIYRIQHLRRRGGTLLYVPPGVYLTDTFNLTSHMTLYLARGAVIKASQVNLVLKFYAMIGYQLHYSISQHLEHVLASVRNKTRISTLHVACFGHVFTLYWFECIESSSILWYEWLCLGSLLVTN